MSTAQHRTRALPLRLSPIDNVLARAYLWLQSLTRNAREARTQAAILAHRAEAQDLADHAEMSLTAQAWHEQEAARLACSLKDPEERTLAVFDDARRLQKTLNAEQRNAHADALIADVERRLAERRERNALRALMNSANTRGQS